MAGAVAREPKQGTAGAPGQDGRGPGRRDVGAPGRALHTHVGKCGCAGRRGWRGRPQPSLVPRPSSVTQGELPPASLLQTCVSPASLGCSRRFGGVANCSMTFWSQTMSLACCPSPRAWHQLHCPWKTSCL